MTDRVDQLLHAWQRTLPDVLVPTSELAKRVMVLSADLDAATRRELADLELTPAEYDVVVGLRRAGEPYRLKPNELSRALLLSTGGTSNVVTRLAARGLVRREDDPDDGRSTLISLTEQGRVLAEQAVRLTTAAHAGVFADVPPEVVREATEALRKVFAVVDRPRRAGRTG